MNSKAVAIVGVTLLLMLLSFAVPTIISASEDPQYLETELSTGETFEIAEGLEITVTDTTNSEVIVDLIDVDTRQNETLTVAQGATENYTLPGGDGTVTNLQSDNQEAMLEIGYDPEYGWSDGASVFADNIGLVLIVMVFSVVVGGLIVVIQ